MVDLKEAPTVQQNFPLLVVSLYITFKTGIAAAGEPIPLNRLTGSTNPILNVL